MEVIAELKRFVPRPTHLREHSAALAAHRQQPTQVEMPKQGHGANQKRPAELAALIATFIDGLDQESA